MNDNYDILNQKIPKIMGILNLTPDSFYDGGRYNNIDLILNHTHKMLLEGADIIDIGAMSTRPGAEIISEEEELERLIEPINQITKNFPEAIISVDTFRHKVALKSIESGGHIINDISGGTFDSKMTETIVGLDVPYILMHIHGNPSTMQVNPIAHDIVLDEVIGFFKKQISTLQKHSFKKIILDPGFGFGKTIESNYHMLSNLHVFKKFGYPVLTGISRKSMIYKVLNCSPEQSLTGTTVLNTIALINGANILRVHDVKEARECITLVQRSNEFQNNSQ